MVLGWATNPKSTSAFPFISMGIVMICDQVPGPETHAVLGAGSPLTKQSWKITEPWRAGCPELSSTCALRINSFPTGIWLPVPQGWIPEMRSIRQEITYESGGAWAANAVT